MASRITSTGSYAPKRIATNAVLREHNPAINPEWTERVLGISERRYIVPTQTVSQLATKAGQTALAKHLHHRDLELIIVASTTPDQTGVSVASYVQQHLGHTPNDCPAFDINAVCSGFVYGLIIAHQINAKHALIIGADTFSKITDWTNRDCVFFGDGAGAVVLSASDYGGILGYDWGSQTGPGWYVSDGFWQMDSKAVFAAAMKYLPQSIEKALKVAGMGLDDIDHVIPHQASLNLLKSLAGQTGLDFDKFKTSLWRYGNTAGASVPLTLDKHADNIKPGDKVLLTSIGAGWTWASVVLEW